VDRRGLIKTLTASELFSFLVCSWLVVVLEKDLEGSVAFRYIIYYTGRGTIRMIGLPQPAAELAMSNLQASSISPTAPMAGYR